MSDRARRLDQLKQIRHAANRSISKHLDAGKTLTRGFVTAYSQARHVTNSVTPTRCECRPAATQSWHGRGGLKPSRAFRVFRAPTPRQPVRWPPRRPLKRFCGHGQSLAAVARLRADVSEIDIAKLDGGTKLGCVVDGWGG